MGGSEQRCVTGRPAGVGQSFADAAQHVSFVNTLARQELSSAALPHTLPHTRKSLSTQTHVGSSLEMRPNVIPTTPNVSAHFVLR
jgi:hypothetical protein